MKAAVIKEMNRLQLQEAEIPDLNDGEALIKVKYCGICGSDLHVLKGKHPTAQFPVIPGHEFVGELADIKGHETSGFQIGDIVVAQPFFSCGHCEPCAKGSDNICRHLDFMGVHRNGAFAQYAKVLTRKMYKMPSDIDLRLAALTEPVAVAMHDVRTSGLKTGETALIIGGGPIGMLIAMVAEHAGARQIVISEISDSRRAFAEELGYQTVNPLSDQFDKELMKLTESKGFDVAFEVSGSKPGITAAVEYTANTGTVMIVGMSSEPYPVDLAKVFAKELKVIGVRIHSQYNFIGAVEMLKNGDFNHKFIKLVSEIYPLAKVEEAFRYAQTPGDYFKILVDMCPNDTRGE